MSLGQVRVCHQINLGGKSVFRILCILELQIWGIISFHISPPWLFTALSALPLSLNPLSSHPLPQPTSQISADPVPPPPPKKSSVSQRQVQHCPGDPEEGGFLHTNKTGEMAQDLAAISLGAFGMLGDSTVAVRQSIKVSLDSIINGSH